MPWGKMRVTDTIVTRVTIQKRDTMYALLMRSRFAGAIIVLLCLVCCAPVRGLAGRATVIDQLCVEELALAIEETHTLAKWAAISMGLDINEPPPDLTCAAPGIMLVPGSGG